MSNLQKHIEHKIIDHYAGTKRLTKLEIKKHINMYANLTVINFKK